MGVSILDQLCQSSSLSLLISTLRYQLFFIQFQIFLFLQFPVQLTIACNNLVFYFLSFQLKGLAISNSGPIRDSHNSFARAEPFVMEQEKRVATEKDDVFHFIAYVPHQGRVFELDGLKSGPILLGEVEGGEGGDWLNVVRPAIQSRIERYATSEIRFNLMGVVKNKKEVLTERATLLQARTAAIQVAMAGVDASDMDQDLGNDFVLAQGDEALAAQLAEVEGLLSDCQNKISAEDEKFAGWKMENIRRKHNYIPFVINLLRILSERNLLKPMIAKAKESASASSSSKRKASE
jgi:ubiquitin carboxyl-terminal hydrolase L5